MDYFNCVFDHDGVVQVRKRVFMGHALQEQFVNVVVLNALRHFLVEISGFPWAFHLNINFNLALVAKLFGGKLGSIVGAEPLVDGRRWSHLNFKIKIL